MLSLGKVPVMIPAECALGAAARSREQLSRLGCVLLRQWEDARANPKIVSLACKAGIASCITALICVVDDPFGWLTSVGIWAVVTVDLVFESDVGTSLR